MRFKGRIIRLRDTNGGTQTEVAPVSCMLSEDEGNLILKISKLDLITGDELRLDIKILEDDDAS